MVAIYITASVAFFCGFCFASLFIVGNREPIMPAPDPVWKMPMPCDGAKRCPQANDVTCEECNTVGMDVKEALVCPSCEIASAYNCAACQERL